MVRFALALLALSLPANAATSFTLDYFANDLVFSEQPGLPYYQGAEPPVYSGLWYQLYIELPYFTPIIPDGTYAFPTYDPPTLWTSINDTNIGYPQEFDVSVTFSGGAAIEWSVYFGRFSGDGFQSSHTGDHLFQNPHFSFVAAPSTFIITAEFSTRAPDPPRVPLPASALLLLSGLAIAGLRKPSRGAPADRPSHR